MTELDNTCILAVDGGGTQSRFACIQDGTRFVVSSGSANVYSDFDGAVSSLKSGIDALSAESGISATDLCHRPAFVGLAGVTGPDVVQRLSAALPLTNVTYADDRNAALRGALGCRDGVLAHCGTGSFLAAQLGGVARLAGGWGSRLGDEASAQWVGRHALKMTLQSLDGFVEQSRLVDAILGRFLTADGVLSFANCASPGDFGRLAPMVTEHAAQDDPVAMGIMEAGAHYLSDALDSIGWSTGVSICLTGGLGPHYAHYLPIEKQVAIAEPVGAPLDGALELAADRQKEQAYGDR